MKIITIHALLARTNRKLAPNGKIHKSSPREVESGLGIWHVTESNTVVRTFDDIADFHHYAAELGVLGDVAHVNFPDRYFPEGSGFEDVASSLYADLGAEDDEDSLDLSYSGPDEEAVAELRDASASFLDRFEADVRKGLPAFGRAALDSEIDACEDRAFEPPLIAMISRHGRDCRLAQVTDRFEGQASAHYRSAVNAAVREVLAVLKDDANVVVFPAR